MDRNELNQRLPDIIDQVVQSIHGDDVIQHLNRIELPNRNTIVEIVTRLREIVYPGYFGEPGLTPENLPYRVGQNIVKTNELLFEQVRCCLRYREQVTQAEPGDIDEACDRKAAEVISNFWDRLPSVRELASSDANAAFEGDPAAHNADETIFCYPGLFATTVQRLAHEFYNLNTPLLPRIMTEYAHSLTGIDLHPGAKIGRSFFIDHGTGVVIGETSEIGKNVKVYQGVTLGAIAPAYGQYLRGQKRHPTIEDDVTIYAGATILGGDTVIGKGSVIGGNVFITSSVPPMNQVTAEAPRLRYRDKRPKRKEETIVLDFQI